VNVGKDFEQQFKASVPDNVFFYRFRDGTASYSGGDNVRFQAPNICDCMIYTESKKLLLLELKSTKQNTIPHTMIRPNQLAELTKASLICNIMAGLIFNYRHLEETYFIPITNIKEHIDSSGRKSIPYDWVKATGLLIPQVKKKIKFKFDLTSLLN